MLWGDTVFLLDGLWGEPVEIGYALEGVQHGDVVINQLERIAVTGADESFHAFLVTFGGEGGDDVIGLVGLLIQRGDAEGFRPCGSA